MDRATKRLEDKQDMLVNIMQKTFHKARNLHFRMKSKEVHIRANRLHEIAYQLRVLQELIDVTMKENIEKQINKDGLDQIMDRAKSILEDRQDILIDIMQQTFRKAGHLHSKMKSKEVHIRANRLHEIAFKLRELQKLIDVAMKEATEERFNGDDVE